eukprot:9885154-Alexandrium_andersonii.AAC.1
MSASLVGSEMCIRDSTCSCARVRAHAHTHLTAKRTAANSASLHSGVHASASACLRALRRPTLALASTDTARRQHAPYHPPKAMFRQHKHAHRDQH